MVGRKGAAAITDQFFLVEVVSGAPELRQRGELNPLCMSQLQLLCGDTSVGNL